MYSSFEQGDLCTALITCKAKGGDMEGVCSAVPALTLLLPHSPPVHTSVQ